MKAFVSFCGIITKVMVRYCPQSSSCGPAPRAMRKLANIGNPWFEILHARDECALCLPLEALNACCCGRSTARAADEKALVDQLLISAHYNAPRYADVSCERA